MVTKKCSLCGIERHIGLFYRRYNGRAADCQYCAAKRVKAYRKEKTLAEIAKGLGMSAPARAWSR